jgi:hypothetical protein
MKCLSIRQPWATFIVHGFTSYDVRTWRTAHRGPLAVHAGRTLEDAAIALCRQPPLRRLLETAGYDSPFDLPRGRVVGVVELLDCHPAETAPADAGLVAATGCDLRSGRVRWQLARPRRLLRPLPLGARRGLFEIAAVPEPTAEEQSSRSAVLVSGVPGFGELANDFSPSLCF